jgi:hypothetical protein
MRVALPLFRGRKSIPRDAKLNIVVLERNQGKGRLPILTEREAKGVELTSRLGETRLGLGETLSEDSGSDVL